jgi:putative ABC transport system permease protein
MFITSTFVIVNSFEISNKELVERFQSQYYIISSSEDLLKSRVSIEEVEGAYIYLIPSKIDNESTYVVGIYDPHNIIGKAYQCNYDEIILGRYYEGHKGTIPIILNSSQIELHILKTYDFKFFPNYWGIINYSLAQKFQKMPNFIIVDKKVYVEGYITEPIVKLSEFYYKSSEEITFDLIFLTLISIVAIYFFINALLNMEIKENTRNISIIRAIGSTTYNIGAIYFLRAIYIGMAGMVLGLSLGIIIAYLLSSTFQLMGFLTYFTIYVPYNVFTITALLSIIGGAIASIQPIRNATKIKVISGMKGVPL